VIDRSRLRIPLFEDQEILSRQELKRFNQRVPGRVQFLRHGFCRQPILRGGGPFAPALAPIKPPLPGFWVVAFPAASNGSGHQRIAVLRAAKATPRVDPFWEMQRLSAPLAVIISMVTTVCWHNAFSTVFVNAPACNDLMHSSSLKEFV
jgi:hypothetical protein